MRKKAGTRIILGVFFVIICFSWILWFFLGKYIDSANYENRVMSSKPELSLENYGTYAEEYTSFFDDNIPFRNCLITLNSAIDYFLFNHSSNDEVIIGKNDWLFYSNKQDGDPIGCYQGENLFSQEELVNIANNCIAQRDFLNSQGKEFVIFIAPNKERINYEYMPDMYGKPTDMYPALQVVEYLKENTDLRVVYPYTELMKVKEDIKQNIWYKTDTHWNMIGGYIGASALLKELGIDMPAIESAQITIKEECNRSGDLAGMLNLSKMLEENDVEYSLEGYDTHNIECDEWDFDKALVYHAVGADPRKIYVMRDSFSSQMALYIGSQFNESYLRHRNSYSYKNLKKEDPDIVVYELVERYADTLGTFSIK